jgi:hypothetical protein
VSFILSNNIAETTWWTAARGNERSIVASVVPPVFVATARIFHPIGSEDDGNTRRWSAVAASAGRDLQPELRFDDLALPKETTYTVACGSLPHRELSLVAEVLARHTASFDVWACIWEGYGGFSDPSARMLFERGRDRWRQRLLSLRRRATAAMPVPRDDDASRVVVAGWTYQLMHGPLRELPDLFDELGHQSPHIWWPDDRVWFVTTDVDALSTYVGGTEAAVTALCDEPNLEVVAVAANHMLG